jgi:hypothetical protein
MRSLALIALLAGCSGSSATKTTGPAPAGGASDAATAPAAGGVKCPEPRPAADSVCLQGCPPPVSSGNDPEPGWHWVSPEVADKRAKYGCPVCLPPDAMIATPDGDVAVSALAVGSMVWSLDERGRRVAVPVRRVASARAPADHALVVIHLSDGRSVTGSRGHPTSDGRALGGLSVGDSLDGARVTSIDTRAHGGQPTWDLLPDSPTGAYWSSSVLLGSTL